ncbi:MAG: SCO family protein [Acidimicrobiia bacterium]
MTNAPMTLPTALLAVLALALAACGSPPEPAGIVRDPAPVVGDVSLPEVTTGEDFAFVAPPDEVLVVYFGFTSCPDVCPTTLADLRRALEELGRDADRVSVAMATVDPGRDTGEVVTGYLHSFVPDGHPLRTDDDAELAAAAEAFGASYEVTTADDGRIDVAHTGFLYAVDDEGRLALTWPFGIAWQDIQTDLELLLDQTEET